MTVVALAGRRIDAPGAPARFPLARVDAVEAALREYLSRHAVTDLVCSAACGADLLALRAAGAAGVERMVVLPFDAATFRRTSVVDRPGDWGPLYDSIVGEVAAAGRLVLLGLDPQSGDPYDIATQRILEIAAATAEPARACLVWEGASRGAGDHSLALADGARRRGWPVDEVLTVTAAEAQPPDSAR